MLIDANNVVDTVKLKFYNEYLYTNHVYAEGDSPYHQQLTKEVVSKYVDSLNLPKDSNIVDCGCGPGYFLDEMQQRGYTNTVGITLSSEDIMLCQSKGHTVKPLDISFLHQTQGFYDESVDFIFLRHALEHSPYPIFTLMEYNRVLKQGRKMYIEVPAPGCERMHEYNINHYSILTKDMLVALLIRTGFNVDSFDNIRFNLNMSMNGETKLVEEHFYSIMVTKARPIDVK